MTEAAYAKIISRNLRKIALENGKTQADIARDLKINKATVSSWMNATRVPRIGKIDLLCQYFHCKRSDLMEDHTDELEERFMNKLDKQLEQEDALQNLCELHGIDILWSRRESNLLMMKPAKPSKYKDAEFMRKKSINIYRRNTNILKKCNYIDEDTTQNATRKKGQTIAVRPVFYPISSNHVRLDTVPKLIFFIPAFFCICVMA